MQGMRDEGYKVILVNPIPQTIMTDPETPLMSPIIEPLTAEILELIIGKRSVPESILPTMGGQTATEPYQSNSLTKAYSKNTTLNS